MPYGEHFRVLHCWRMSGPATVTEDGVRVLCSVRVAFSKRLTFQSIIRSKTVERAKQAAELMSRLLQQRFAATVCEHEDTGEGAAMTRALSDARRKTMPRGALAACAPLLRRRG